MRVAWLIYHLALADFLERVRRYSFLITVGFVLLIVYAYLPPRTAGYLTLGLGDYRGIYNSAWVGSAVALLASAILSLPAFYVVNEAIEIDRQTRVGHIIATTPINNLLYVLGKALSNLAVLCCMAGIAAVAAVGIQLIRGEETRIEFWALLAPFIFGMVPAMALVASLAILFEAIEWLNGTVGNIVYFLLWLANASSIGWWAIQRTGQPVNDPLGITFPLASVMTDARQIFPDYRGAFAIGMSGIRNHIETFYWAGPDWRSDIVIGRLLWVAVALGIACLASLFFTRFDSAREQRRRVVDDPRVGRAEQAMSLRPSWTRPKPLPLSSFSRNFGVLLLCELRLALKGRSRRWHLVMAILVVASILAPYGTARQYLWPLVWAWPVVVWSGMGSREVYYQTCEFVFTAARPLSRQLSAAWLAGVLITSTVGAGIALRLALAGDVRGMFAWLVATLFIPTLALALGTWSGSRKLFEVTYMLLLYLGPINRVAPFDFMGASGAEEGPYVSLCYLVATLVLGVLAVALRRRQLQMA